MASDSPSATLPLPPLRSPRPFSFATNTYVPPDPTVFTHFMPSPISSTNGRAPLPPIQQNPTEDQGSAPLNRSGSLQPNLPQDMQQYGLPALPDAAGPSGANGSTNASGSGSRPRRNYVRGARGQTPNGSAYPQDGEMPSPGGAGRSTGYDDLDSLLGINKGNNYQSKGTAQESGERKVGDAQGTGSAEGENDAEGDEEVASPGGTTNKRSRRESSASEAAQGNRALKQTKRAAQNRAAQQAFRKRKEERIKELEDKEKTLHKYLEKERDLMRREQELVEREQAFALIRMKSDGSAPQAGEGGAMNADNSDSKAPNSNDVNLNTQSSSGNSGTNGNGNATHDEVANYFQLLAAAADPKNAPAGTSNPSLQTSSASPKAQQNPPLPSNNQPESKSPVIQQQPQSVAAPAAASESDVDPALRDAHKHLVSVRLDLNEAKRQLDQKNDLVNAIRKNLTQMELENNALRTVLLNHNINLTELHQQLQMQYQQHHNQQQQQQYHHQQQQYYQQHQDQYSHQ